MESLFNGMIKNDKIDTSKAVTFNYRIGNIMRCSIFDGLEEEAKDRFRKMERNIEPFLPVYEDDE